jgi:DNA-binding transcriptional ArsR family regulator
MKRNLDLCREILQRIEAHPKRWYLGRPEVGETSQGEVEYHIDLLRQAELVTIEHRLGGQYRYGLTWAGHEFLDATRDDTIWTTTKKTAVEKTGGLSLAVVQDLAISLSRMAVGLS